MKQSVLYVGVETGSWSLEDYNNAAMFAKSAGFDALAPKVADGLNRWYGAASHLKQQHDVVTQHGIAFLPYHYVYGPSVNTSQIDAECAILHEMLSVCGYAQADMEVQWNGQIAGAQHFAERMHGHAGRLTITTWADPNQQNWQSVLRALEGSVDAFIPQQYTVWLAQQEWEYGALQSRIEPALEISKEFAGNNPQSVLQLALQHNHETLWMWEYEQARANLSFVQHLNQLWHASNHLQSQPNPTTTPPVRSTKRVTQTPQNYQLIHGIPRVSAYEVGKSEARDAAAALASLAAFAYPNRWPHLDVLATQIYEKYCGSDTSDNATPLTKEQALAWCSEQGIGTYDLATIIAQGDIDVLRHNMASMNVSEIPVLMFLGDASRLKTFDGKQLHPYANAPRSHAVVRLGYRTDQPYTMLYDPCAPAELPFPTTVEWKSITDCTIVAAFGVMPPKTPAPDASFVFWTADGTLQGIQHAWPVKQVDATVQTLVEMQSRVKSERTAALSAIQAQFTALEEQEDNTFAQALFGMSNGKYGHE